MAFLLDANVMIAAKNLHYGFDFCPGFWDWLVTSNASGKTFSIEKVGDEIRAGDDPRGGVDFDEANQDSRCLSWCRSQDNATA